MLICVFNLKMVDIVAIGSQRINRKVTELLSLTIFHRDIKYLFTNGSNTFGSSV
jgi:hypothetical protein